MKKETITHLLLWALAITLGVVLNSCAARKTDKSKTEETVKTEVSNNTIAIKTEDSNVKKTETITVDNKNETVTKETVYEPIDATKPASIIDPDGKKTDLNNSKKTTKETTQKNNTKTDNSILSAESYKSELSEQSSINNKSQTNKSNETKNVEKKAWSVFNLLWLLILVPIYLVYKNRWKIVAWFNGLWFV